MFGEPAFYHIKDVFISYAGKDIAEALWVKTLLEANGISCWMAPDDIPGGSSYADQIPSAIDHCKVFVLVFSEKTNDSIWVPKEMIQALNGGKLIMPFMLENCALRNRFGFFLADVQQYAAYTNKIAVAERMVRDIQQYLFRNRKIFIPDAAAVQTATMMQAGPVKPAPAQPASEPVLPADAWKGNVLRADDVGSLKRTERAQAELYGLGVRRSEIGSVTFLDRQNTAPDNAADVSAGGDRSVLAWVKPNGPLYDLFIAGNGGVNGSRACEYLFADMAQLRRISFRDCFYTDDAESMKFMFAYAEKLEEVDLSGIRTGRVNMYANMFSGCSSLKTLDVSGFDTSAAKNFSCMFQGCSCLTALDVSGFDTSAAENFSSMFQGCSGLTALDVSGFETSAAKRFYCMFQGCSSLKTLDLSGFDSRQVTNMVQMFQGCSSLETLEVSKLRTEDVTLLQGTFSGCTALTELDLSRWYVGNVKNTKNLFNGCTCLRRLDLTGWDLSGADTTDGMFRNCTALTPEGIIGLRTADPVTAAAAEPAAVKAAEPVAEVSDAQPMAWRSNWLMASVMDRSARSLWGEKEFLETGLARQDIGSVTFLDSLAGKPADAVDVSGRKNGTVLAWAKKNGTYYDVTIAADGGISGAGGCRNLFAGCCNLETIHFNHCFHTDDARSMAFMFYDCNHLKQLDVSDFVTSNVMSFDRMFNGCMTLTKLDVSGFDTSAATGLAHMFHNCVRVQKLDVSGFKTDRVMSMAGMFHGCRNLSKIDVSGFETERVTDFTKMFYGCKQLTQIDLSAFDFHAQADVSGMFDAIPRIYLVCDEAKFSASMPHDQFLPAGVKVNGRPWEELF